MKFKYLLLASSIFFSLRTAEAATTRTVTSLADSGAGTLRDTIAASLSGDTINFSITGTITLTSGELVIGRNFSILGPGATLLGINGNNAIRVFNFTTGTVSVSGLLISNGQDAGANGTNAVAFGDGGPGASGFGGGILNSGTLVLSNCVVSANYAGGGSGGSGTFGGVGGDAFGGGIYNQGTLVLFACVFSGNATVAGRGGSSSENPPNAGRAQGGAVYNQGILTVVGCSFDGNSCLGAMVAVAILVLSAAPAAPPWVGPFTIKAPLRSPTALLRTIMSMVVMVRMDPGLILTVAPLVRARGVPFGITKAHSA